MMTRWNQILVLPWLAFILMISWSMGGVYCSKLDMACQMMTNSVCEWKVDRSLKETCRERNRRAENISGRSSMRPNKPVPHTCADIKREDPEARDGEYWLFPKAPQFHGEGVKIYCLINTTHPLEYLTLKNKNFGVYPKYRNKHCHRETLLPKKEIIHAGNYQFLKIRIKPTTMAVVTTDATFTLTIIKKLQTKMVFGMAIDCYARNSSKRCGPKGIFHINMQGTGTKFNPYQMTWKKYGFRPFDPVILTRKPGSVIDVKCGGYCGWCKPKHPLILYPSNM